MAVLTAPAWNVIDMNNVLVMDLLNVLEAIRV